MTLKGMDKLSPEQKKVAARALSAEGYSSRRIEALIGIDQVTAWRAAKETTPEKLKLFETDFKEAIAGMKTQGVAAVHTRMLELIPRYQRLDHLVKAGQYFEGKLGNIDAGVNINAEKVLVVPSELVDKYNLQTSQPAEIIPNDSPIAENQDKNDTDNGTGLI